MFSSKIAITTIALSAVILAGAAEAKTKTKWVDVDGQATVTQFQAKASAVNGWDVFAADGKKVGKVEEAVGTSPSKPAALVVNFEKGSDYRGRRDVVVPLNQFSRTGDKLVLKTPPARVAKMETHAMDSKQHASNTMRRLFAPKERNNKK